MLEEQEYDLHVHHKGYINAVTHNVPTSGSKCENDFSVSSVILFPLKSLKWEHVAYLIQNNTRYIDIEAAGGLLKWSHLAMTTYISVKMPPLPGLNTYQSGGDVKPQFLILLQTYVTIPKDKKIHKCSLQQQGGEDSHKRILLAWMCRC